MPTTYGELIRQTMLKMQPRQDGITRLAVEQSINDAHRIIAMVEDFDEMINLDTTNAFTVANQNMYYLTTDPKGIVPGFNLVNPKDIYSIRLMDDADSRKLLYMPYRTLDKFVPWTQETGTDRSNYYVQRGMYLELYPIPDSAYPLYIQHSQWPTKLVLDADQTCYLNIDFVIVQLAADLALDAITPVDPRVKTKDWSQRARELLGISVKEEEYKPDQTFIAQPFSPTGVIYTGSYWLNPWMTKQPQTDDN